MIHCRQVIALIIVAALSVCLSSCKREKTNGPVKISFMTGGTRAQQRVTKDLIKRFEKLHPNIKVRLEWGTSGDFYTVMMTRMVGKVAPDVMFMQDFQLPYFASRGQLLDLTPYVERDFKEDIKDYYPESLQACTSNGKLYAIPQTMVPLVLFYNKKIFDEAKIPYPDGTWTFDTLRDAAIKLTKRDTTGRPLRLGLSNMDFRVLIAASGATLWKSNPTRFVGDSTEAMEATRFGVDLINKYHVAPDSAELRQQTLNSTFALGRAAMSIGGAWYVPEYNAVPDLDYDIAPMPKWRNGHRGTVLSFVGYTISSESKHKKEAWAFLKFISSPEMTALVAKEQGNVPPRYSVAKSSSFLTPKIRPLHDEVFLDSIKFGCVQQCLDPKPLYYWETAVESSATKTESLEQAMADCQRLYKHFLQYEKSKLLRKPSWARF